MRGLFFLGPFMLKTREMVYLAENQGLFAVKLRHGGLDKFSFFLAILLFFSAHILCPFCFSFYSDCNSNVQYGF